MRLSLSNALYVAVSLCVLLDLSEAGGTKCRPTTTTTLTPTETAPVCSLGTCLTGFELCGDICGCATTAEGTGFCAQDAGCAESPDCITTEDCPNDSMCIVNACCGTPKCLPPCASPGALVGSRVSGASGGRRALF